MAEWTVTDDGTVAECPDDGTWLLACDDGIEVEDGDDFAPFPFDVLARLMASNLAGREAMAKALRTQGWCLDSPEQQEALDAAFARAATEATERTNESLAQQLRAAGWTCCPPGSRAIWVVEAQGEPTWDDEMCFSTQADAQVIADDQLDPTTTAVRYVRAPAPTGGGGDREPGPRGGENG